MPEIDIDDLKKNTDYNGYRPADKGSFYVSPHFIVSMGIVHAHDDLHSHSNYTKRLAGFGTYYSLSLEARKQPFFNLSRGVPKSHLLALASYRVCEESKSSASTRPLGLQVH
jgi:hypothetical protein